MKTIPRTDDSGVRRLQSDPVPALRLASVGATHTGRRRRKNEDRFAVDESVGLFVVADGMGGHAAGEVAATIAVEAIVDLVRRTGFDPDRTLPYPLDPERTFDENRLGLAFRHANDRILEEATKSPRCRGMGTTGVALLATHDGFYVAHVGDSRAYLFRDGALTLLTDDHTLYNELLKAHAILPSPDAPQRNVLMRALGTDKRLAPDVARVEAQPGDTFLLCSDGLHGPLEDQEIGDVLRTKPDLDEAAHALIDAANEHGGPDNVTVVLTRWRA